MPAPDRMEPVFLFFRQDLIGVMWSGTVTGIRTEKSPHLAMRGCDFFFRIRIFSKG